MSHSSFKICHPWVSVLTGVWLLVCGAGCSLFRNPTAGTGSRFDAPRDQSAPKAGVKKRDMLVEVTTDATGAVTTVQFKRSSGADTVDSYVADSIRKNWPPQPSTTTLAELTYSMADGFSQPKMISSHPAP